MTSQPSIKRTDLLTAQLKANPSIQRVEIKRVDLAPGQATGTTVPSAARSS